MPPSALTAFPIFQKLASPTLAGLAEAANLITFAAGAVFYKQNDAPSGLYCLQTGCVKLYRQSRDRAQILAMVGQGEAFGAESLASHAPSPCTAQAIASGRAVYLAPTDLQHLMERHLDLSLLLLELVMSRLHQFTDLVQSLAFHDVSTRLAEILLKQNSQPTADGICIPRLLTQQDLAAMVGTAREVVSRTLKRFESEGLLRLTPTEIIILDPQRLTEIARQETR